MFPKVGIFNNFISKVSHQVNQGSVVNLGLKCDSISFGNSSVIKTLSQKKFQEFCEELYRKDPEKCQVLLNSKNALEYLDSTLGCFSDEFVNIKKDDMNAFIKAVDNISSEDIKKIISSVEEVRPDSAGYAQGKMISKVIILHSNDKAAYDYIINSPAVRQNYVYSSGYSPDLFVCVSNYPERVVDTMSLSTVKEIEKSIKHNYRYEDYSSDSDSFCRNEQLRKKLHDFLSSQIVEDDITAYRGERSTWIFDSIPVDKSLAKQVRLFAFLNPDSRKTKIFPNTHMYSSSQTQSVYDYLKSKEKLTLADAMLVAKYGSNGFRKRLVEEINKAHIQDDSFKSFTLDRNFAERWANNYSKISSPTIISKTAIKRGNQAGYDVHSGGEQFEFVVNDNLKKMTFSNARYDKDTNTFYVDSTISAVE